MKSEGILLDLDNTVYDYKSAHEPAMAAALKWLAGELEQNFDAVEKQYVACRQRVNQTLHGLASSHSRLLYFQGIVESFGRFPHQLACQAEDLYWQVFFENMQLRPGCLAFLESVGLPIAVVTDLTARIQFEKIAHLKIAGYLQAIVTSEESGHEKPHPRIFEMAAHKLDLPLKQLCMIGDSLERDIEGAHKLGLNCFWYSSEDDRGRLAEANSSVTVFDDFLQLLEMVRK
ncbi:MAG: HAD family hydrolase [Candidatus Obscuribacterales bacterium]|jgi:putative hydrolase of the HAD superfamily